MYILVGYIGKENCIISFVYPKKCTLTHFFWGKRLKSTLSLVLVLLLRDYTNFIQKMIATYSQCFDWFIAISQIIAIKQRSKENEELNLQGAIGTSPK